jgi:pSer/pThr/pTyr-binding forkhead associated (FHA) protein
MPRLLVNPGSSSEWEIPLRSGAQTIGRSKACDFTIEHDSVSGTHCELLVSGGAVTLKDLGSTNGTFLERAPITESPLSSGQRFQLGSVELQFLADPPPVAAAPRVRIATAAPAPARVVAEPAMAVDLSAPRVALHMAPHESPPAPPAVPMPFLTDEYSMPVEGPVMCKYHPKMQASWLCAQCSASFCDLCIATRPGPRTGKFCRKCSTECLARHVQLIPESAIRGNFFSHAPRAFTFPFKGNGLYILVIGAVCMAAVEFLERIALFGRLALFLFSKVLLTGYLYAFMQNIIQSTANGEDKPPAWPDFNSFWEDMLQPYLQLLGCVAFCFGPAIALNLWLGWWDPLTGVLSGTPPDPFKLTIVLLALLTGAAYFPMALLAVSMFDSLSALNPMLVIPSMLKAKVEYLVVLLVSAGVFVMIVVKAVALIYIPIPILPSLVSAGISLYLFMVEVRLLGLLYRAKRHELGWFTRR